MVILFTNNRIFLNRVKNLKLINLSAYDVLIDVRNSIHLGSHLLTHPLCGNLKPSQQPFRSVLLEEKKGSVDFPSLSLIEEAIAVYRSAGSLAATQNYEKVTLNDYAFIDFELMRASLEHYRVLI